MSRLGRGQYTSHGEPELVGNPRLGDHLLAQKKGFKGESSSSTTNSPCVEYAEGWPQVSACWPQRSERRHCLNGDCAWAAQAESREALRHGPPTSRCCSVISHSRLRAWAPDMPSRRTSHFSEVSLKAARSRALRDLSCAHRQTTGRQPNGQVNREQSRERGD